MKKIHTALLSLMLTAASGSLMSNECRFYNAADEIPTVQDLHWEKVSDVAQYGKADWSNVVGKASRVSLQEAKALAEQNPGITYFFYVKGYTLVLEDNGVYKAFHNQDAVFFTGTPHWGEANGLADGYIKR